MPVTGSWTQMLPSPGAKINLPERAGAGAKVALAEGVLTGARSNVADGRAKPPVAVGLGALPPQAAKRVKVIIQRKIARIIGTGVFAEGFSIAYSQKIQIGKAGWFAYNNLLYPASETNFTCLKASG